MKSLRADLGFLGFFSMGFDGARCCGVSYKMEGCVFVDFVRFIAWIYTKKYVLYTDILINKSDCWVNIILFIFYMFTFYSCFLI